MKFGKQLGVSAPEWHEKASHEMSGTIVIKFELCPLANGESLKGFDQHFRGPYLYVLLR